MFVNFFAQYSDGIRVGQWDLSLQKMKSIPFFIPTPQEQKNIICYIEQKTISINSAISAIEKEITLITEYRTRLISDVVTGKVDVRGIVVEDAPEVILDIEEETAEDEMKESEG